MPICTNRQLTNPPAEVAIWVISSHYNNAKNAQIKALGLRKNMSVFAGGWVWVAPSGLWNFKARLPRPSPLTAWRRTMGAQGGKSAPNGSVLKGILTRGHWQMIAPGNWGDTDLGIKSG